MFYYKWLYNRLLIGTSCVNFAGNFLWQTGSGVSLNFTAVASWPLTGVEVTSGMSLRAGGASMVPCFLGTPNGIAIGIKLPCEGEKNFPEIKRLGKDKA